MSTRRQFLQGAASLAALAALGPGVARPGLAAEPLLQRAIPSSGERLPVIGLGTSRTFDATLAAETLDPLLQVVRTFFEGGARLIDTAPSYGRAEAVSGELVARSGHQGEVFWATKVSSRGLAAGRRQLEQSFAALRTARLDLVQVHNLIDTGTQLGLLRELREEGRVRYLGITHYLDAAHDDLLATLGREKVDVVQLNYAVGERNAERRLLPYCRDHGIAVLVNRPFQRGTLFQKVRGQQVPVWAVEELQATSWAQLMLKYLLADEAVTAVLPATSNPRYMADNLAAGRGPLPDATQRARILEAFA